MSQKIITFLSASHPNAVEKTYLCPDGTAVTGVETNEAPVCHLLYSYPEISQVICIVTEKAKRDSMNAFQAFMESHAPAVAIQEVSFSENDFAAETLGKVMENVNVGDTIYLDVTGGFRTSNMYLLLLSRILLYTGVNIGGAVYGNYQESKVEDVTQLFRMFDLVEGMQELTSLGSVRMLRTYYGGKAADEKIEAILSAMEDLFDTITLCRTKKIDDALANFGKALACAKECDDPLMRQLLPTFRVKFGEELDTLDLIQWCIDSNMLQQALTVYTERVPKEIMRHIVVSEQDRDYDIRDYEDPDAHQYLQFLSLSCKTGIDREASPEILLFQFIGNTSKYIRNRDTLLEYAFNGRPCSIHSKIKNAVDNLSLVLRAAYPVSNDVYEKDWRKALPEEKAFLSKMDDTKWDGDVDTMLNNLEAKDLCILFGCDKYTLTLQNLKTLFPASNYRLRDSARCPLDKIREISCDYLYIKALRNLTNHANSESNAAQELQISYLEKHGYKTLNEVCAQDIKSVLQDALKRLREVSGGKI